MRGGRSAATPPDMSYERRLSLYLAVLAVFGIALALVARFG